MVAISGSRVPLPAKLAFTTVGFNTSFASNPGPSLELFWAWCQCQRPCHAVATAIFGPEPCSGGADAVCVSKTLVSSGDQCLQCLRHVDEWFASFFQVWIQQAKQLISTGKSAYPGICPAEWKLTRIEHC